MTNKYEVYDMCNGVMKEPKIVYAKSPLQAVRLSGYETAVRTTDIGAPLLVKGKQGGYSYHTSNNLAYFRVADCSPCVVDMKRLTEEMKPFLYRILLSYAIYELEPIEGEKEVTEKIIKNLWGVKDDK